MQITSAPQTAVSPAAPAFDIRSGNDCDYSLTSSDIGANADETLGNVVEALEDDGIYTTVKELKALNPNLQASAGDTVTVPCRTADGKDTDVDGQ